MNGVAISGRAGAGKTALAKMIQYHLGGPGRSRICPIAEPLKQEVYRLYGLRKADPGGREKLIEHGELRRLEDPWYWINRTQHTVEVAQADGRFPIVDDLRFPTELQWARELGFLTVRVESPVELRRARLSSLGLDPAFAESTEAGETSLDRDSGWDLIVHNTCSAWLRRGAYRVIDLCGREEVELV